MITQTKQWGAWAEQRVTDLLQGRGWCQLERNWVCRWGELDLVMTKGDRLLVVEVKGRRSTRWALAAVDRGKRRRLARAIDCWRAQHPDHAGTLLEVVVAVVPLPPASGAVRWTPLEELS